MAPQTLRAASPSSRRRRALAGVVAVAAVVAVSASLPDPGSASAVPPERDDAVASEPQGAPTWTELSRARVRKTGAYRFDVDRAMLTTLLADPAHLAVDARGTAAEVAGGVGMKVTAVRPGGVLRTLGIRSGDVIASVDGAAVDVDRGVEGLIARLARDGERVVALERRGRPYTLVYAVRAWTAEERATADAGARAALRGVVPVANEAPPAEAPPVAIAGPAAGSGAALEVDHAALLGALDALERVHDAARYIPIYKHQQVAGVELTGVREGGLVDQLGLRTGDVVVAVDGFPLARLEDHLTWLEALARQARVELTLDGADGPRTRAYTVRRGPRAGPARPTRPAAEVLARRGRLEAAVTLAAVDLERVLSREVIAAYAETLAREAAAWEAIQLGFAPLERGPGTALLFALGLKGGADEVVAVDGVAATGLVGLVDALVRRDRVRITGTRRGVPLSIEVAVRPAADSSLARELAAMDGPAREAAWETMLIMAGATARVTYTYRVARAAVAAETRGVWDVSHEAPIGGTEAGGLGLMPPDSVYRALGLRSRDVLVAFDGEPVSDRAAAVAGLLDRLDTAQRVTLTLTRGRDETVLVYLPR